MGVRGREKSSPLTLAPSVRPSTTQFSVRYFLNLVLVDDEDRRYFKQQEITLWRRSPDAPPAPEPPLGPVVLARPASASGGGGGGGGAASGPASPAAPAAAPAAGEGPAASGPGAVAA
jgi:hypothetical protein